VHLRKVRVLNFRLLKEAELVIDPQATVIVGRNNCGKTSFAELFRRLFGDKPPRFELEDFSLGVHQEFLNAFELFQRNADESEVLKKNPRIEVELTIDYEGEIGALGTLTDFIIDLNPLCTQAVARVSYELAPARVQDLFLEAAPATDDQTRQAFYRLMKERIPKLYHASLHAIDPNDVGNIRGLEWVHLKALVQSGFIHAQRGLDDTTHKENDVLGRVIEALFNAACADGATPNEQILAKNLNEAIRGIQEQINTSFNELLDGLIPAFSLFGYPGLKDPNLRTETTLDIEPLLSNHSRIRYLGANGVHLPEAYNGLGARNLIFILLKLLEFFRTYRQRIPSPALHLIFIEEPEAHLHPQMQEVFIGKLCEVAAIFTKLYSPGELWPVQFVVTTHSAHVANRASFTSMRYFLSTADGETLFCTKIKDLNDILGSSTEEAKFVHQYMTLTRCDLLFADKAVLIEGTTERLLLPRMVEKIQYASSVRPLSSQYVTIMEVGGAYAHLFFPLLAFLELRALIITDLDTVDAANGGKACKVSEGTGTSNACIKTWFSGTPCTKSDLLQKPERAKVREGLCLAYEVPEEPGGPCGRSFEDAFMLANADLFGLPEGSSSAREAAAWDKAASVKKSDFALKYAIEVLQWKVPKYIGDGLRWLAEDGTTATTVNVGESGAATVAHIQVVAQDSLAAAVVVKPNSAVP
jgi:putative ATP-dependent endonuclease of OLD family